ncbi:tRNA/tmRNA (uracil-C(5))-methyltransferase [Striga asiatica]|uniref:tRNA/tmRNA (Uracil-C(5))-methyltransferase n=1 Tax=Striga asiatica TaxID=4170 RepID=A0A5A7PGZ4_STRAF|nr:tRNA/tmRNA (uracil-C(5))-methyltransferase [Striga asiatica]
MNGDGFWAHLPLSLQSPTSAATCSGPRSRSARKTTGHARLTDVVEVKRVERLLPDDARHGAHDQPNEPDVQNEARFDVRAALFARVCCRREWEAAMEAASGSGGVAEHVRQVDDHEEGKESTLFVQRFFRTWMNAFYRTCPMKAKWVGVVFGGGTPVDEEEMGGPN